jgi:hypothetical protein
MSDNQNITQRKNIFRLLSLSYVTFYDILVLVLRACIPSVRKYYAEVV